MHEWSLAQNLLQQVEELRRQHGAARVTTVRVEVGDLAGVEAECLHSAFTWAAEEGPAKGANLELQRVPVTGHCANCQHTFSLPSFHFVCIQCGSKQIRIVAGEDLVLKEVVLEFSEAS